MNKEAVPGPDPEHPGNMLQGYTSQSGQGLMQGNRCGRSIHSLPLLCSCFQGPDSVVAVGLTEGQWFKTQVPCLPVSSYVTLDKLCSLNFPVSHWVNDDS